ncbi:MAG TPA: hypothetical protein PKY82_28965 [Pyrinomonadaceae bacterium]|nr:hypothetical protein [Pyrinomonadaceae bacterium]
MKKKTNFCSLLLFYLIIFAVLTLQAFAQNYGPKFKVGDSVEVDTLQTSKDPEKSLFWRTGKIIKVNDPENPYGSYIVKLDKDGREMVFSFTWTQWMRPPKKENKPEPNTENPEKENPPAEIKGDKVKPEKEQKLNENTCQLSDETGGTTQSDIFKRLIRLKYEHQPKEERDFTTTVTFQSFKSGATHKWRSGGGGESPDGPGGRAGITIYPIKVVFTVCSDYPGYAPTGFRGEIQRYQDDTTFNCLKNEFGEWQCNLGDGKSGPITHIKK